MFDNIRKKWILLTAEEWVRQHLIQYLIVHKKCPESLIGVEVDMQYNRMKKRADIVVYNRQGESLLIIECKAPDIALTEHAFEQVLRYYIILRPRFIAVSNGLRHYCLRIHKNGSYAAMDKIPSFEELTAAESF